MGKHHKKHHKKFIKNRFVRDVLRGTVSKVLQVGLVILGVYLIISGLINDPSGGLIISRLVGGVICMCVGFGVKYALGQIIRVRW